MSDNVRVPFGDSASDTATLLLAAAEESKDFEAEAVQVSSYGGFVVPKALAKAAGVDYEDVDEAEGHVYSEKQIEDAPDEVETPTEAEKPAKKAAAKKTTAKKAGN
jgi:hypothetical protein